MDGTWKIGELAEATGLTVRTLHHYDEIGLLLPSGRSEGGHRLYAPADVRRLFRIVALRALGLTLEDIRRQLDAPGPDLREALRAHLRSVEAELGRVAELRERIARVLAALDEENPSADDAIDAIEVMTMIDEYYTDEQRAELARRAAALGDDGMQRAQQEWAELIAEAERERAAGPPPADPRVQALARRWQELVTQFTGGDPAIAASLKRMYEEQGAERASRGAVSAELMAYMAEARTSL